MSRPPTIWEFAFAVLLFVVTSAAVLLPAWRRSTRARGVFRLLHFVPALPMVVVSGTTGWALSKDATAANLWPIGFAIYGAFSFVLYLLVRAAETFVLYRKGVHRVGASTTDR